MNNWIVYILECNDKTYYTGITNDLSKRLITHNKGKASRYTRSRLPVTVIALKQGLTKSQALKLEYKVKQRPKKKKVKFLLEHNI